ncbi:hypothetical protein CKO20_15900 [Rhodocyclus tenuis]|nr:hypothetical protein [Rhodocyclus tenuis]
MRIKFPELEVSGFSGLRQLSIGELLVASLLVLSMTQGAWVAAGVRESILKAALEAGFIALFAMGVAQRLRSKQPLSGIQLILPFCVAVLIGLVSGIAQGASFMESLFYVRLLVVPLLFLVGLLNVRLDEVASRRLLLLIASLMLLQLPFFAYKWMVIGVEEKHWIGALSQTAGQLGLIFPMLVLSLILPRYLASGSWLVLLILIYSFLPIINEKRAVIIVLPALFFAAAMTYVRISSRYRCNGIDLQRMTLGKLAPLIVVLLTIWISSVKLIPSLQCAGDGPCVQQTVKYGSDYLFRDYLSPMNASKLSKEENTNIQLGRLMLIKESTLTLADKGWETLFFGLGGGAINPSPNLGPNRTDIMFDKFGLRGTYSFCLMLLWEGGIASVIAAAGFFVFLWLALGKQLAGVHTNSSIIFGGGIILMVAVLAFDFFIYSTAGWLTHSVTPFIFTLSAIFLRHGYPAKVG